jgi:uncharacterized protein DUF4349
MERSRECEDVAVALATLRPVPRPAFAAELDERVAAGFPRQPHKRRSPILEIATRIGRPSPRRTLFAGGTTALAAIAIATVVVASTDSGPTSIAVKPHAAKEPGPIEHSSQPRAASGPARSTGESESSSETVFDASAPALAQGGARASRRDIERSAEIGLLADPNDVAEDSAKIFNAVHDADGIVLRSTTTQGRHASADFDLLIPSQRLGDALAALSAIDEVRSRHETTADITAPTVSLDERLRDSRAKIDGLLSQLAEAETESEAELIESELRTERRHSARLKTGLARLHRRRDFSRVSVRIETGETSGFSEGSWGIDDALGDAGHILSVALGVTVIGLAALVPLALAVLLAVFAHRAWLRRARDRALA